MSRYTLDTRVTAGPNDGYLVDRDGTDFHVCRDDARRAAFASTGVAWWNVSPVADPASVLAVVGSADDAIRRLIGDPQSTEAAA